MPQPARIDDLPELPNSHLRNPDCPVCGDHPTVTKLIDYEQFCGLPSLNGAAHNGHVAEGVGQLVAA